MRGLGELWGCDLPGKLPCCAGWCQVMLSLPGADLIRQVSLHTWQSALTVAKLATVAFLPLWTLAVSLREFGFEIQNSQTTKGWSWKWI